MSFYQKYLKYKNKYLKLMTIQSGGAAAASDASVATHKSYGIEMAEFIYAHGLLDEKGLAALVSLYAEKPIVLNFKERNLYDAITLDNPVPLRGYLARMFDVSTSPEEWNNIKAILNTYDNEALLEKINATFHPTLCDTVNVKKMIGFHKQRLKKL